MRGSFVVLAALAMMPFVARVSSAQTDSVASSTSDKQCVPRDRGNPSDTGLTNRADPTTKGNKDCLPPGHTTVSGFIFFDLIQNGVFDTDENGLSGWQVQISGPNIQTQTFTTGGDGAYSFSGLLAGTYTVCVMVLPGWTQTAPTGGPQCDTGIGYTIVAPVQDATFPNTNFGFVSN